MKHSLRTKLTLAIAIVALLATALISFISAPLIKAEFNDYAKKQLEDRTKSLLTGIGMYYSSADDSWNRDFVHAAGMVALGDGFIIKLTDAAGNVVWDAMEHDMSTCYEIMDEISERMGAKLPELDGSFKEHLFDVIKDDVKVGIISIIYFTPFFLTERAFHYLSTLNAVILGVGFLSLLASVLIGFLLAGKIANPLKEAAEAAAEISSGNYSVRMQGKTGTLEIDGLVRSVNHLAESLEKQEAIRKRLAEDIAHEVRTPVAILQTHLEAMIEGLWQPTPEHLASCYDESVRIGQLIRDIDNLAGIESGEQKLELSEFNVTDLARKNLAGFEVELGRKGIRSEAYGPDMSIIADRKKIGQVLINLISNAAKYTGEGGSITVSVVDAGEDAVITVGDTGSGIRKDEQENIFERFYRADRSRDRKTGGTGIGLSIVKSIVEAHGGKVGVTSEFGKGSIFEVRLPKRGPSPVNQH